MLQVWIVSPRESLYFAAAATPRNLTALHRHVRRMQRHLRAPLRLSLSTGGSDDGVGTAGITAFLRRLASEGVRISPADVAESSGTLGPPVAGSPNVSPRGDAPGRTWGSSERVTNHLGG